MDALKVTTPSDREVLLSRTFAAPCEFVFQALTQPELLRSWYGPAGWRMVVCDIDLRVGGAWRFVVQRPDGKQIGQRGVYQEIERPRRIVNTENWEDWDAGETLVTTVLTRQKLKTLFECTILFPSQEVRDVVVKAGLEHGAEEGYKKLESLCGTTGALDETGTHTCIS